MAARVFRAPDASAKTEGPVNPLDAQSWARPARVSRLPRGPPATATAAGPRRSAVPASRSAAAATAERADAVPPSTRPDRGRSGSLA